MSFLTKKGMPTDHADMETKQTTLCNPKRENMSRRFEQVEMHFSITTQEPVEQVKAMEVVIMTVLTMI
jgi:hypothetical protein